LNFLSPAPRAAKPACGGRSTKERRVRIGLAAVRSEQVNERPQPGNRLDQTLAFERDQQLFGCLRRVAEALSLLFDGGANRSGGSINKRNQEVVGV
jgi:hypothetical protein